MEFVKGVEANYTCDLTSVDDIDKKKHVASK